MLGQVNKVKSG